MEKETKKQILDYILQEKCIISPGFVKGLEGISNSEDFFGKLKRRLDKKDVFVIDEKILAELEKLTETKNNLNTSLKVVFSYEKESKKRSIPDFVALFNARYKSIKSILTNRQELQGVISVNRLLSKTDREKVSLIGLVKEKETTKNGNIMLEVEDPTGIIKVLINKNNSELFKFASDIVLDEVIGVVGVNGDKIVFANQVIFPDLPINNEIKKSPNECYALFLSDLHVGSKMFLGERLENFLKWINIDMGNEIQKEIASKVGYIFILGDLVDGVGIYPGQEEELTIKDIFKQYEACAELLKKIPLHIKVIICGGNHDALRISEPQPPLSKDFAKSLWGIPNLTILSNPSIVNIHGSQDFRGFDVLLYHGYSFDYYVANIESIRNNGGYHKIDQLMKFLLQKRHLAPSYASTLFIPDTDLDPLVIEKVPDFFVTGHVHSSPKALHYRGVTLISSSCWQSITPFQEKVGHTPDPAKVPIVNLQTREVKILKF
jgi:DNA polymerase II small subunit